MSKKWSSFGEQQLLTENWRKFLTEEEVQAEEIEEGFLGRIGTAAKAGAKAAKKSWDETRPKPMSDYPATEMTTIVNLISSVAKNNEIDVDVDSILKQLEDMLKDQNFVVKEEINGGELMLGQPLNLDLDQVPTLKAFLKQISADDANLIMQAFQRGGFKIGDVPVAQQKQAQSAADQQSQPQDDVELPDPEKDQAAAPAEEPVAKPKQTTVDPQISIALIKQNFEGEESKFEERFASFIRDLRNLLFQKTQFNEINNNEFSGKLGKSRTFFKKLIADYPDIFAAINKIDGKSPEGQQFMSSLMSAIKDRSIAPPTAADVASSKSGKKTLFKPSDSDSSSQAAQGLSKAEKERDQMVDKMIAVDNYGDFVDLYGALGRSSFGKGKESIDDLIQNVADISDSKKENNKKFTDEIVQAQIEDIVLNYVSSFGSDKRQQIKDKFMELIIKPILGDDAAPPADKPDETTPEPSAEPEEKAPEQTAQQTKTIEDAKEEIKEAYGEGFEAAFARFVQDIRNMRGLNRELSEITNVDFKSALGLKMKSQSKAMREFKEKHKKMIAALRSLYKRGSSPDQKKIFLDALKSFIETTPREDAGYGTGSISTYKPSQAPKEESKFKFPEDDRIPENIGKFYKKHDLKSENEPELRRAFSSGQAGYKLEARGSKATDFRKYGRAGFESKEEAHEHWESLYQKLENVKDEGLMFAMIAYLIGLKRMILSDEPLSETLNESTMVRWKELAGIL